MRPSSTALFRRQGDPERRSAVGAGFHRHGTAVQNGNFADERKPQPHAAHLAAIRKNGWKTLSRYSGGMPIPVSETCRTAMAAS